jgi:hypothetical protein
MLKQYKELLKQQLEIENELVSLLEECFKELFPDDHQDVIRDIQDSVEFFEHNGCLPSLSGIRIRLAREKEQRAKYKAQYEAERKAKEENDGKENQG